MAWLDETRGLRFDGYPDLWQWSVTDLEGFWQAIWDFNDIVVEARPRPCSAAATMPGAQWFPGARLNYAENVLHQERPGEVALYYHSETKPVTPLYWDELGQNVRILATQLRSLGVQPGDRVASTLPNIPEAVIAMLAATSIGAIWTSVSPDFGWRGVLDRFRQLQPKVLICTGGYRYGGKDYDRSVELNQIIKDLACLEHVIYLPFEDIPAPGGRCEELARSCSTTPRSTRRTSSFTAGRSECRCGSCSLPAPPDCRKLSPIATAAS